MEHFSSVATTAVLPSDTVLPNQRAPRYFYTQPFTHMDTLSYLQLGDHGIFQLSK